MVNDRPDHQPSRLPTDRRRSDRGTPGIRLPDTQSGHLPLPLHLYHGTPPPHGTPTLCLRATDRRSGRSVYRSRTLTKHRSRRPAIGGTTEGLDRCHPPTRRGQWQEDMPVPHKKEGLTISTRDFGGTTEGQHHPHTPTSVPPDFTRRCTEVSRQTSVARRKNLKAPHPQTSVPPATPERHQVPSPADLGATRPDHEYPTTASRPHIDLVKPEGRY